MWNSFIASFIFNYDVDYMYENLDDFGAILDADGKAILSFATRMI